MKKFFNEAKGHMMTGIGYMLPLIIGASLVVAIPLIMADSASRLGWYRSC